MTFLPIAERELRVGARRRSTYWTRVGAAVFALLILIGMYTLAEVTKGAIFSAGRGQFSVLEWLGFIFACSAGLFLTSDLLSEEKREGTLGLLFLTDLRGHDVVLGKLVASSMRAIYGLLAAFPAMALTLLSGGVTGGEFWRMMLILCNTIFVSISAGLLVSALSRDAVKAINAALLLLLLLLAGLPLFDLLLAGGDSTKFVPIFSFASPAYLFRIAGPFMPRNFWLCVLLQHGLAWGMLAVCSIVTPRTWQEKATESTSLAARWFRNLRFGGPRGRAAIRKRLLEENPVLWLAVRDRWLKILVWSVVVLAFVDFCWTLKDFDNLKGLATGTRTVTTNTVTNRAVTVVSSSNTVTITNANGTTTRSSGTVVVTTSGPSKANAMGVLYQLQYLLMPLLFLWVTLQACRFFVDAVRNGAMELLLVTPITPRLVVQGQAKALWRVFLVPVVIALLMEVASGAESILEMRQMMRGTAMPPGFNYLHMQIMSIAFGLVNAVTTILALGWYGMWQGLKSRKTTVAVLKTICFVSLLPFIALLFVQVMVMAIGMPSGAPFWLGTIVVGVLHFLKDLGFITLGRTQLKHRFREAIQPQERPALPALPPPLPPPLLQTAAGPGSPATT